MPSTRRTIATALMALAATAPVAAAHPLQTERAHASNYVRGYVRSYVPQKYQTAEVTSQRGALPATPSAPSVRTVVVQQPTGFDWLDAAIGAAVAAGVLGLSGAAVLIVRRSPDDARAPLGAH